MPCILRAYGRSTADLVYTTGLTGDNFATRDLALAERLPDRDAAMRCEQANLYALQHNLGYHFAIEKVFAVEVMTREVGTLEKVATSILSAERNEVGLMPVPLSAVENPAHYRMLARRVLQDLEQV